MGKGKQSFPITQAIGKFSGLTAEGQNDADVLKRTFAGLQPIAFGKCRTTDVFEVVSNGSKMHVSREFLVESLDGAVHAGRDVEIEGRHEIAINHLVIALVSPAKLCTGKQLHGVTPLGGCAFPPVSGDRPKPLI